MILTANFPYQQPYTIPGDRRAPLRRGYNRYRNNQGSSWAPRILCRITLPKLQQQPDPKKDDLMQFAIVLSIIGTLFVGFQKFASLEAGLDEVKNEVRKIDKLDDKIDRFLTDINQERVDIADLKGQVKILTTK
jgi:hypothetical protein